jgi:hypothetical protein
MKSQNGLVSAQARSPKRDRKKRKLSAKNGFWSEENPSAAALLNALTSVKSEDFSVRLPLHWTGMARQVADTFAEVVVSSEQKTKELAELRQVASENKAWGPERLGERRVFRASAARMDGNRRETRRNVQSSSCTQ